MISQATLLPVERDSQVIGYEQRTNGHLIFFGTRHASREMLANVYPDLKWFYMKQEHGHRMARASAASNVIPQADALWSTENAAGVLVSTADCVPILIACDGCVSAIHAGWRGVLNGITIRSLRSLRNDHNVNVENLQVVIGPHIQQEHFEFDRTDAHPFLDLAKELQLDPHVVIHERSTAAQKVNISLKAFVFAQLKASGFITISNVSEFLVDTYSHKDFHSHRRDRIPGRNLSFVARL